MKVACFVFVVTIAIQSVFCANLFDNLSFLAKPETWDTALSLSGASQRCTDQMKIFHRALNHTEKWSLQMFDATAKLQTGILMGNIMHIGNYDECIQIEETIKDQKSNENIIEGKYCSANLKPHKKYGKKFAAQLQQNLALPNVDFEREGNFLYDAIISYAFCIPAACSAPDLQKTFDFMENQAESPVHFRFREEMCMGKNQKPLPLGAMFTIMIFGVFAVVIFLSTLYELCTSDQKKKASPEIFTAFSLIVNTKRLFSVKGSLENLDCLNGIRVISMLWIVVAHRFMYGLYAPKTNIAYLDTWRKQRRNTIFLAAEMSVDTFFAIGGLLVVYIHLRNNKHGSTFPFLKFYLHRIFRLTPSLVMVVLFSTFLIRHVGNGPFWPAVYTIFQKPCESQWWVTLSFMQNQIKPFEQCVGQAWYLAVDTQMYFVSPLILIPLVKRPKLILTAIAVYVVLNSFYVLHISYVKKLAGDFMDNSPRFIHIYIPTYIRGTVYLMGMACGYFAFVTRTKKLQLAKLTVYFLWTISLITMVLIILGFEVYVQEDYGNWSRSLFNAFSRVTWALAICIVITLCINGYGGYINDFLAHKMFAVLIRFNYNIYLLHLIVIVFVLAQTRTADYFDNFHYIHKALGDYVLTLLLSFCWTLAFEAPFITLEKLFYENGKTDRRKHISDDANVDKSAIVPLFDERTDRQHDH